MINLEALSSTNIEKGTFEGKIVTKKIRPEKKFYNFTNFQASYMYI